MNPPPIDRENVFRYVKACTWALPSRCADLDTLKLALRAEGARRLAQLLKVLADLEEKGAILPGIGPQTWYTARGA